MTLVLVGAIVACLTGCQGLYPPEVKERRLQVLTTAVDEFDAASLGDIICDLSGGEPGVNRYYQRILVIAGTASWDAAKDLSREHAYSLSENDVTFNGVSPRGVGVNGSRLDVPGSRSDLEADLADKGCDIPDEGAIVLAFMESGKQQ